MDQATFASSDFLFETSCAQCAHLPNCAPEQKAKFPGGQSEGETPVPIPNTAAKTLSGDGTMWATTWESSTSPGIKFRHGRQKRE